MAILSSIKYYTSCPSYDKVKVTYKLSVSYPDITPVIISLVANNKKYKLLPHKVGDYFLIWHYDNKEFLVDVADMSEESARLLTTSAVLQKIFDEACQKLEEFQAMYSICSLANKE